MSIDSTPHGDLIVLLEENQTAHGLKIVVKQEDIRQVQLAKAAIRSAIDTLISEAKISYEDIDCIYLPGLLAIILIP